MGARGLYASICDNDLSQALALISDGLRTSIGANCLVGPILDASAAPGLQPDCEVFDTLGGQRAQLPPCTGVSRPCYEIAADPVACPFSLSNLSIVVERDLGPAPGTTVVVECLLVDS
jgi:hypothetical protein